ncbi:MAG: glycosyltransferase family 39 protein, partial [Spirochaetota bacterium]
MHFDARTEIRPLLFRYGAVVAVFIMIIAVRVLNLDADPPVNLSTSGGLFGDEAALAHNARNKALFGHWITDEWNPLVYNPILSILEYASFMAFGVGLVQLRLVNLICVILSFFLLWKVLIKSHNFQIASLSIFMLGFNYIFTMYNRLGLNDTFIFFPMAMTLYFWQNGLDRKPLLFFAGIASFAVYITKASSLYFVLAALFSLLFALFQRYMEGKELKDAAASLGYFLGGLILSYICWYLFFLTPLKSEFEKVGESWIRLAWPGTIGRFWYNLTAMTFAKYMNNEPIELFITWGYLPVFLCLGIRSWRRIRPMEVFIFLWLIGGFIALNGLSYKPLRYFVPIIPPVCLTASFALSRLWNIPEDKAYQFRFSSIYWVVLILTVTGLWLFFFFKRCISFQRIEQIGYPILGIAAGLLIIFIITGKIRKTLDRIDWKILTRIFVRSLAVAGVAFSFYINSTLYLRWSNHLRYTVIETSR